MWKSFANVTAEWLIETTIAKAGKVICKCKTVKVLCKKLKVICKCYIAKVICKGRKVKVVCKCKFSVASQSNLQWQKSKKYLGNKRNWNWFTNAKKWKWFSKARKWKLFSNSRKWDWFASATALCPVETTIVQTWKLSNAVHSMRYIIFNSYLS